MATAGVGLGGLGASVQEAKERAKEALAKAQLAAEVQRTLQQNLPAGARREPAAGTRCDGRGGRGGCGVYRTAVWRRAAAKPCRWRWSAYRTKARPCDYRRTG